MNLTRSLATGSAEALGAGEDAAAVTVAVTVAVGVEAGSDPPHAARSPEAATTTRIGARILFVFNVPSVQSEQRTGDLSSRAITTVFVMQTGAAASSARRRCSAGRERIGTAHPGHRTPGRESEHAHVAVEALNLVDVTSA
jgi:hypothetical protein